MESFLCRMAQSWVADVGIQISLITYYRGSRGNGREELLASLDLLCIPPHGVFFALPSHPVPAMSDPPRGANTREIEEEVKRVVVTNRAWTPRKAFFVGLRSTGLPM